MFYVIINDCSVLVLEKGGGSCADSSGMNSSLGDELEQLVETLDPSHEVLVEDATVSPGGQGGAAASHEPKTSAASRRVWLLMAAW